MTSRTRNTLITVVFLLLASTAIAQNGVPPWDWSMVPALFSNILFMAAAIVGLTNAIRKWQPAIDGPILVPAVAAGIGAVLGLAGQLAGALTATGFNTLPTPWGGLLYGITAALGGTISLNLIELVGNYLTRGKSNPAGSVQTHAFTPSFTPSTLVPLNAGAWIVEHVRSLLPQNKLTAALDLLAPLIGQVASQALTDELRADLQGRIHTTLRKGGLLKGRDL